jgi:integrase
MADVTLDYLNTYTKRGKVYAYYRRDGRRVRLRGAIGSPAMLRAYEAAHLAHGRADAANAAKRKELQRIGTVGALIREYQASPEWAQKQPATRADYAKGLNFLAGHSHRLVRELKREHVIKLRNAAGWDVDPASDAKTLVPSRANKVLAVLSILLTHAVDLGWRTDNPALGVKRLRMDGEGYRAWTDAEIAAFRASAPAEWVFALLLALGTGQRGQDQVAMRWADYDGTGIRVVQRKGRGRVALWIPCHPALRAALDGRERRGPMILTRVLQPRQQGGAVVHGAWPVNAFQKAAGSAIRAAGLSVAGEAGVVWHGLRAVAASWLAEAGCPDAEIQAITGHTTARMVQHYRRGAAQKTLAASAVARLDAHGARGRGKAEAE